MYTFECKTNKQQMERRRHPRTTLQVGVRCVRLDPDEGDVIDRIYTLDFSRSGLGALSDLAYYPGQRVILCLPGQDGGSDRRVYATVRRVRPDKRSNGYRLGLEFEHVSLGGWSVCTPTSAVA